MRDGGRQRGAGRRRGNTPGRRDPDPELVQEAPRLTRPPKSNPQPRHLERSVPSASPVSSSLFGGKTVADPFPQGRGQQVVPPQSLRTASRGRVPSTAGSRRHASMAERPSPRWPPAPTTPTTPATISKRLGTSWTRPRKSSRNRYSCVPPVLLAGHRAVPVLDEEVRWTAAGSPAFPAGGQGPVAEPECLAHVF
jgi:hypothetical protein